MIYFLKISIILLLTISGLRAQPSHSSNAIPDHADWYAIHQEYEEASIQDRFFKHDELQQILDRYRDSEIIDLSVLGKSIEGREIYSVSLGSGPIDILLWSQMHGDEPTATMAIVDLLRFFTSDDQYNDQKEQLLDKLSLHFIPMLNPDGAEDYSRFNALGIDLNRDALRLQCPESRILKKVRDSLNADFGFNLHDQSRYYSAGRAPYPASISFLAPAFNDRKEVNTVRKKAMQLIALMDDVLQHYIPNQVGRFSDAFEPRAFGDNMQKWGTSTVLIEAGGLANDPEKQKLRRLHFTLLLSAFQSIAEASYSLRSISEYEAIPENTRKHHDLLLRQVRLKRDGRTYIVDLGFKQYLRLNYGHDEPYYHSSLVDIGDLSTEFGYTELEADGYEIMRARTSPLHPASVNELSQDKFIRQIKSGYPIFEMNHVPSKPKTWNEPFVLTRNGSSVDTTIFRGANPVFYLGKEGEHEYLVANGQLFKLDNIEKQLK